MNSLIASIRLVIATLFVCSVAYPALILGFARVVAPNTAQGSLIQDQDGHVVGSRLIAQKFTRPGYFWPRPSACDYNGAGAAGSNKSPTNPELADRARTNAIPLHGATSDRPLPADLAAASGGGLDPHITERAARYQAARVAQARNVSPSQIETLIDGRAFAPGGGLTPDRLVNVLELNLALDAAAKAR